MNQIFGRCCLTVKPVWLSQFGQLQSCQEPRRACRSGQQQRFLQAKNPLDLSITASQGIYLYNIWPASLLPAPNGTLNSVRSVVPIQTHLFYSSINTSSHVFQAGGNHKCVFSWGLLVSRETSAGWAVPRCPPGRPPNCPPGLRCDFRPASLLGGWGPAAGLLFILPIFTLICRETTI